MKNQEKIRTFILFIFIFLFIAGCSNAENIEACLEGQKYGFLSGLWHGIIAPIDLVVMLFRDDVTVYAPNNNGAWYAFGFVLGSGGWGIMGGKSFGGKRKA